MNTASFTFPAAPSSVPALDGTTNLLRLFASLEMPIFERYLVMRYADASTDHAWQTEEPELYSWLKDQPTTFLLSPSMAYLLLQAARSHSQDIRIHLLTHPVRVCPACWKEMQMTCPELHLPVYPAAFTFVFCSAHPGIVGVRGAWEVR